MSRDALDSSIDLRAYEKRRNFLFELIIGLANVAVLNEFEASMDADMKHPEQKKLFSLNKYCSSDRLEVIVHRFSLPIL